MKSHMKILAFLVPYIAVGIGMYLLSNAWLSILLYHAGIIFFLLGIKSEFSINALFSGWEIRSGILSIVLCSLAGVILYELEIHLHIFGDNLSGILAKFGLDGGSWIFLCIYFVTVHPVLEEIFWRGMLAGESKLSSIEDAAFAGYHIFVLVFFIQAPFIIIAFLLLMIASWLWRSERMRNDGLLVPVLSHIVSDLSVIISVVFLLK